MKEKRRITKFQRRNDDVGFLLYPLGGSRETKKIRLEGLYEQSKGRLYPKSYLVLIDVSYDLGWTMGDRVSNYHYVNEDAPRTTT